MKASREILNAKLWEGKGLVALLPGRESQVLS